MRAIISLVMAGLSAVLFILPFDIVILSFKTSVEGVVLS